MIANDTFGWLLNLVMVLGKVGWAVLIDLLVGEFRGGFYDGEHDMQDTVLVEFD